MSSSGQSQADAQKLLKDALGAIRELQSKLRAAEARARAPIMIVGMNKTVGVQS